MILHQPHRRGTCCSALRHREWLPNLQTVTGGKRGTKKTLFTHPCWQSSREEAAAAARKSLLQRSIQMSSCCWCWDKINSWDTKSVWSWHTVASSLFTRSGWVFFLSLSPVFTVVCLSVSPLRRSHCVHQACFTTLAPMLTGSSSAHLFTGSLSPPCISPSLRYSQRGKCLRGWLLPLSACSSASLPFRQSRPRQKKKISWMICHALSFNGTVT